MDKAVIRTITYGLGSAHPLKGADLERAAAVLRSAEREFTQAGHPVQTVRITTRSVFDDLADASPAELVSYGRRLQTVLDDLGIDHFSLGPAPAARPDFPLDRLALIPDLVAACPAITVSAQLATVEHGIRAEAAGPTADAVLGIARQTPGDAGNFRFAALFCVGPGHPFFPAGYHEGPDALSIGLQGAGIVTPVLAAASSNARPVEGPDTPTDPSIGGVSGLRLSPDAVTRQVREALLDIAGPITRTAEESAVAAGLHFGGIDLSPAPSVEASIGAGIEAALGGPLGAPGTVAIVGAITRALRSTGLPTCGYNGLMLPVLEDEVLAAAWERGELTPHQLLAYSAICGTGLDTVPFTEATTADELAGLFLDTATLAVKLSKPLSARLFPVPGVASGQRTAFQNPYLIDIRLP